MIDSTGAKAYRAAAEQEARAAAKREDHDVWLRAIGRIAALDYCLSDEENLALASQRIPFTKRTSPPAGRRHPRW